MTGAIRKTATSTEDNIALAIIWGGRLPVDPNDRLVTNIVGGFRLRYAHSDAVTNMPRSLFISTCRKRCIGMGFLLFPDPDVVISSMHLLGTYAAGYNLLMFELFVCVLPH